MSGKSEAWKFQAAVIREAAHAAVAEHFGLRVVEVEIDWRGFPVCHYDGELRPEINAFRANVIVLVAGLVGERIATGQNAVSSDHDLTSWMEHEVEFDPDDHPDAGFHPDLVLALDALGGELESLNECEREAHRLLQSVPIVNERWQDLRASLGSPSRQPSVGVATIGRT